MGLRQACSGCYLRAGHTLYGRLERLKALRRHDYKSSSLHHLYKWLSFLFVSVRWGSSETLAADSAVLREQFESSWRFSWGKWVRFFQFLWMLCCPLNMSSCVKTLVHTPFDLLSPDTQRASFCRSSSPRNCWDATEATSLSVPVFPLFFKSLSLHAKYPQVSNRRPWPDLQLA